MMENRENVTPGESQTLITPELPQELNHYADTSAPNGRNLLAFQFYRQAKRDFKNGDIRLLNQINGVM